MYALCDNVNIITTVKSTEIVTSERISRPFRDHVDFYIYIRKYFKDTIYLM